MEEFSLEDFPEFKEDNPGPFPNLPRTIPDPQKIKQNQKKNATEFATDVLSCVKNNTPLVYSTFIQKNGPQTLGMVLLRETIDELAKKEKITTFWDEQTVSLSEWDILVKETVFFDYMDKRYKFVFGVNRKFFSFDRIDKQNPPDIKDLLEEVPKELERQKKMFGREMKCVGGGIINKKLDQLFIGGGGPIDQERPNKEDDWKKIFHERCGPINRDELLRNLNLDRLNRGLDRIIGTVTKRIEPGEGLTTKNVDFCVQKF